MVRKAGKGSLDREVMYCPAKAWSSLIRRKGSIPLGSAMDNKTYYKYKQEERARWAKEEKAAYRKNIGFPSHKNKLNVICLKCRKAYNRAIECPIHKCELYIYFNELPKKNNDRAWKRIERASARLRKRF